MAEEYSVTARLRADASGFLSAFDKATNAAGTFGSKMKSGLGLGVAMAVGQKAVSAGMSTIENSISSAAKRVDTLNNFPKVMKSVGFSAKDAAKATKMMDAGIDSLPTTMDGITSNVQILAATMGNLSKGTVNATSVGVAMNDMLLSGGKSAAEAASAFTQYTQMLAAGRVDQMAWNSLVVAAPAQMKQLSETLLGAGKNQKDLYKAMQSGEVTFDDFNKAVVQLDKNGGKGFDSFSTQARNSTKGIITSVANCKTAVVKGLANMLQAGNQFLKDNGFKNGFADIFDIAKGKINSAFSLFYTKSKNGVIKPTETMGKVLSAAGSVFKAFSAVVGSVTGAIGKVASSKGAVSTLNALCDDIVRVSGFIEKHSDGFGKLATGLIAISLVRKFPGIGVLTSGLGNLAKIGLGALASKLFRVGGGMDKISKIDCKQMISSGASFALLGAGIAATAAGFYLLAKSAVMVSDAGPAATATFAAMVISLGMLMAVAAKIGTQLTAGAAGFIAFGAGILVASAGIYVIAQAMTVFTTAATNLASSGSGAVAVFAVMIGVVAALVIAAAAMPAAFIAAGIALAVLGAGLLVVATAGLVAANAINVFAECLPTIATYGTSAAVAIVMLGASLIAAGALLLTGGALALAGGAMFMVAGTLCVAAGTLAMAGGTMFVAFGAMVAVSAAGVVVLLTALKGVMSTMKGISSYANSARSSLSAMNGSINAVKAGMSGISSAAKASLSGLTSAFSSAASQSKSSGTRVGTNFASGVRSGLNSVPSIASHAVSSVTSRLRSGAGSARSAGAHISSGFAAGMRSGLGEIEAAANRMVAAADRAIRAKAKIHSPSRLTKGLGAFVGKGFADGIISTYREIRTAASGMISMPNVAVPAFAGSYDGSLSSEYNYNGGEYTIIVPVEIDGKETARVTAPYTEAELNKRQARANRKKGVR